MAAYVCRSGYELWKRYLSSLLCDSAGFLRFWAAYTQLIYRNQRDCMTAQIHINLMTYYHGEIASAFLAGSMWLHLGATYIQSISFPSWATPPPSGLTTVSVGKRKKRMSMKLVPPPTISINLRGVYLTTRKCYCTQWVPTLSSTQRNYRLSCQVNANTPVC